MSQPKIMGFAAAAVATVPATGTQPLLFVLGALAMIGGTALLVRTVRTRA